MSTRQERSEPKERSTSKEHSAPKDRGEKI